MRPRSHQRDERHRSRRAALPKYFPLSHSTMTLFNGLISLNLTQIKLNIVARHRTIMCRDKPALTREPQREALSRPKDVKLPSDCDLNPPLITTLLTFLSTPRDLDSAPMLRCLRRRLMTGSTLRPGTGDLDLAPHLETGASIKSTSQRLPHPYILSNWNSGLHSRQE